MPTTVAILLEWIDRSFDREDRKHIDAPANVGNHPAVWTWNVTASQANGCREEGTSDTTDDPSLDYSVFCQ
jgi:hypothetical protein